MFKRVQKGVATPRPDRIIEELKNFLVGDIEICSQFLGELAVLVAWFYITHLKA
jgi:hypothetical protein